MDVSYQITHYYHSGFSVASGDTLLVFDYWRGEEGELTPRLQISPEKLAGFAHIFVFISHDHIDHLDPIVFTWRERADVTYIVASDMPIGTRGRRMAPGDTLVLAEDLSVQAFDSTDPGVSFLVHFKGLDIFHAGDLNFWHWREESTMQEIEEADADFRKAVEPLTKENIDVAFFPLDPRQGAMFEAGANYFILAVKPHILIPMHYFHRADVAMEYARTATCRTTEVIAMPGYGDSLQMIRDDEGFLNLFPLTPAAAEEAAEEAAEAAAKNEENVLEEDNPFLETDLPLDQLVSPVARTDKEPGPESES